MKIKKSILTMTAIGALFVAGAFAAESVSSHHAPESKPKVVASDAKDCHKTTDSNSPKAKSGGHCAMPSDKAMSSGKSTGAKTVAACCK